MFLSPSGLSCRNSNNIQDSQTRNLALKITTEVTTEVEGFKLLVLVFIKNPNLSKI